MKKLDEIDSFGNIDANLDQLLSECFEEHEAYKDLLEFRKYLIIGKKGTGKTSIYRKVLEQNDYNIFSLGYNLRNYPWNFHKMQEEIGVPDNQKYVESWKYLILLELSKVLSEDGSIPFDEVSRESIEVLRSFIKDTYGSLNSDISNVFTPHKKIRLANEMSFKLLGFETGVKLPFEYLEMKDLPKHITEINKNLTTHLINCIKPSHKYYICFDELDIGFEDSENYKSILIGLIRAAMEIILITKEKNKLVNICVFLRDDIYEILKFEDKRKITQNFVARIDWDNNKSNTLKELMEKRFSKLLQENNEEIMWENVFDSGKKINGKIDKYDYIKGMTCLRPRDIIDFCNIVLSEYKKRKSAKGNYFLNEDIINAKEDYSSNLYDEFIDEIHKHLENHEIYFEILKKMGKIRFTYDEFLIVYEKHKNKLNGEDPEMILNNLFDFSIIGNYKIGGVKSGSKKVFKYKNIKISFDKELEIIVHQGLADTLDLTGK